MICGAREKEVETKEMNKKKTRKGKLLYTTSIIKKKKKKMMIVMIIIRNNSIGISISINNTVKNIKVLKKPIRITTAEASDLKL